MLCDREFLEQEPHVSLLLIDELELGRKDICRECFAKSESEVSEELVEKDPTRVWWRTRHTVAEKKGVQLDLESLQALFDALLEKDELGWQELRYLLCLILMRKRRLKVLSVKRIEGLEVFIVRKPRTEIEQTVRIFDFTPERQEELRATLTAIFEGADLAELDPNAPVVVEGSEADESPTDETSGEASDPEADSVDGETVDETEDEEGTGDDSESIRENGTADADPVKA